MKIEIIGSTNNLVEDLEKIDEKTIEKILKFSGASARICYSSKKFSKIQKEKYNAEFIDKLIKSGHHSVFGHINFNFLFSEIPKALAMVVNNEKEYNTSEKSARYTEMSAIEKHQKKLYDKWMKIFLPKINQIYPKTNNPDKRTEEIEKLAQENARYMTSVFTPTEMVHTLNLRQLNFILQNLENFNQNPQYCSNAFSEKLSPSIKEFINQLSGLRIPGLNNQTDRSLSLFNPLKVEECFGNVYSTKYKMGGAGIGQGQRHRTINYHISDGTQLNAPLGFFTPELVKKMGLEKEWIKDLESVAKYDFPQAQLLEVNERGILEDFRSKALLRICGNVQHELMINTLETAKKYDLFQERYGPKALEPKCRQGMTCYDSCNWGGKRALERLV